MLIYKAYLEYKNRFCVTVDKGGEGKIGTKNYNKQLTVVS